MEIQCECQGIQRVHILKYEVGKQSAKMEALKNLRIKVKTDWF